MKNTRYGKGKRILATGLCLFAGAMSIWGCGQTRESENLDLTINVEAANPVSGDLTLSNEFMGSVSPEDTVYVYPKAQGEVTAVNFEVGDTVNEGDVLFTIDDEAAKISLQAAQVGQASAQAQASAAQIGVANAELTERDTIDQLNNAKVLSLVGQEGTMESLDTQIKNAELSIKQIEISMSQLEDSRSDLKGRRNELDNAISGVDDAIGAAPDEASKAYLQDTKAQLISTRDTLKANQESLDDQIESLSMQLQQAKNSLAQAQESKQNTADRNLVQNVETDRQIGTTTEKLELGKQSAQAQANAAQVGVRSAAVNMEQAELALSYYTVTAPISGVIQAKNVELHNNASAQQPAYIIANQNSMTVTFNVSEDVKNTMKLGDALKVDRNGQEYDAKITEISDAVNSATGLFQIKGTITSAQGLASGVAVKIKADTYSVKGALLIPYSSVYYEDGAPYVYVARDGVAVKTYIQTGLFDDQSIVVTDGLTAEDAVITSWSPQLSDGAMVRVVEPAAGDSAAGAAQTEEISGGMPLEPAVDISGGMPLEPAAEDAGSTEAEPAESTEAAPAEGASEAPENAG